MCVCAVCACTCMAPEYVHGTTYAYLCCICMYLHGSRNLVQHLCLLNGWKLSILSWEDVQTSGLDIMQKTERKQFVMSSQIDRFLK